MGRNVTSNDQGSNEVGELVPFDTVASKFVVGGRTYLRTGVLDDMANYPDFPAELGGGKYATFELSNALPANTGWSGLAYGAGVYVTVSDPQALSTNAASSPDGITWTARTLPVSERWTSVAYGNGVFAAVAGGTVASTAAASSPDGITWTARTLPTSTQWRSVCYGDKFVAVGGVSNAATSSDGITWTARTLPTNATGGLQDVAWSGSRYVAVAGGSTVTAVAAYSLDGVTWTASTLPIAATWKSVAYGNGVFVAVAGGSTSSTVAATSPDGITWTQSEMPSSYWTTVRFGDGVFIAGGYTFTLTTTMDYAVSSDGITWTKRRGAAVTVNTVITGIVATPGKVVMVSGRTPQLGNTALAAAQTSTDTTVRTPTSQPMVTSGNPNVPLYMRMK